MSVSLSVEGCKRITEGSKETKILFFLNPKLYFGVYDYSLASNHFPESLEIVTFPSQGIKMYQSFSAGDGFKVCGCVQSGFFSVVFF